jgi:hypothetical protein
LWIIVLLTFKVSPDMPTPEEQTPYEFSSNRILAGALFEKLTEQRKDPLHAVPEVKNDAKDSTAISSLPSIGQSLGCQFIGRIISDERPRVL